MMVADGNGENNPWEKTIRKSVISGMKLQKKNAAIMKHCDYSIL